MANLYVKGTWGPYISTRDCASEEKAEEGVKTNVTRRGCDNGERKTSCGYLRNVLKPTYSNNLLTYILYNFHVQSNVGTLITDLLTIWSQKKKIYIQYLCVSRRSQERIFEISDQNIFFYSKLA
jgi:hypothetical protein